MVTADADIQVATPVQADPSPPGDAGGPPVADAATADIEAFLESRGGKEGDTAATEPTKEGKAPDPVDAELEAAKEAARAEATEKATRETQDRLAAEAAQAQAVADRAERDRAFQAAYRQRGAEAWQETYDIAIELGLSDAEARAKADKSFQRFNSHHADAKLLSEPLARAEAAEAMRDAFNRNVADVLGSDVPEFFGTEQEPKTYRSQAEALTALKNIWQKGRMTEAEVKAHTTRAILDYRRDLEAKGLLTGTASSRAVNGSAPDNRSTEARLADPTTPISEITRLLAEKGI